MPDPPYAPPSHERTRVLSASEIERTLVRLAHEIAEKTGDTASLALVGIERRGVPLARRLASLVSEIEKHHIPTGTVNITNYRDDLSRDARANRPVAQRRSTDPGSIGFDINGRNVILVDDVLFTGRSARAALDALMDQGRPARVQVLVLIDRGHRELPIEAAYVGRYIQTRRSDIIEVKLVEVDGGNDEVLLVQG
jgi:pyrimidine operon attenuation protein / uracil phosphoribosyltransferase